MANDPGTFQQDTLAATQAAGVIERAAGEIGLDGSSGHVGELRKLLNDLANEWHSQASVEHQEFMAKWNASVVRLAELTKKISVDLRTGTDTVARTASHLGGPSNPYTQRISGS
jgi:uncharacterized protein YukE